MSEVFKRDNAIAMKVPEHIAKALGIEDGDSVDFELLNDKMAGFKKRSIGSQEIGVLKKLSGIKFADRTKENMRKALSDEEQKTLGGLMKLNAVTYYDEGKYKGHGVYSIARNYYTLLSGPEAEKPKGVFSGKDYIVVSHQGEAERLLADPEVKKANVVAVRGFDKQFYFATSEAVSKEGDKIIACLEASELSLRELAEKCRLEEGLVNAVVEILRESGDLIEKRKGIYALA